MPSRGKITPRTGWSPEELAELTAAAKASNQSIDELLNRLGPPIDVWLNDVAYWRSVPTGVWEYSIGGYQVFKKWLSYREQDVLGRPLRLAEARDATGIVRRLAAIILLGTQLDTNYKAIRADPYAWPKQ
jgi:Type ISP C-terminal specificity domain